MTTPDFYVEPTGVGAGMNVVCRDCAHAVFGRDLASHVPSDTQRAFLKELGITIKCQRCQHAIEL